MNIRNIGEKIAEPEKRIIITDIEPIIKEIDSLITAANTLIDDHNTLVDQLDTEVINLTVSKYKDVFKRIFEKSGHIAHYNMMMGIQDD